MDIARFDDTVILDLMPDGVLALDRDLLVRRINPAACRFLGVAEPEELIGAPVSRVMDEAAFLRLRDGEETQCSDIAVLRGGEALLDCAYCRDADRTVFVCLMRDMPEQQEAGEDTLARRLRAAGLADALCARQLQLVQEIAGLLGETAVETQAAVQELKKTLLPDRVENHD